MQLFLHQFGLYQYHCNSLVHLRGIRYLLYERDTEDLFEQSNWFRLYHPV